MGGLGNNRLVGGPGADVFVFGPGDGAETVTDFNSGTDKIDLTGLDIDNVDAVTLITGDKSVTVDPSDIGSGSILLEDLAVVLETGDILI